ncbi:MAG: hypothetical protein AMJ43_00850 [Coxiella sp. DG_40]|nr:MAG: hypothetical protein AMJ43_00850 [Coxiella sp. DG_40]
MMQDKIKPSESHWENDGRREQRIINELIVNRWDLYAIINPLINIPGINNGIIPIISHRYRLNSAGQPQSQFWQSPTRIEIPQNNFFESIIQKIKTLEQSGIDISNWTARDLEKHGLDDYIDPITYMLILNPVSLSSGCTVDGNEELKTWLEGDNICPCGCGRTVNPQEITPNNEVGRIINEGLQRILDKCLKVNSDADKPELSESPSLHM